MKRLPKLILILSALLVLAGAAAVWGLGWYVGSDAGRVRIQAELSKALGLPLEIQRASLGWDGIRLSEVKIPGPGGDFLEAPSFTAGYKLLPLLQRQVVLDKMVLESPRIVWPQDAEGKWVLPVRAREPKRESSAPREHEEGNRFELALDKLEVRNGSIVLLDRKQQRFADARQLEARVSLAQAGEANGTVTAATVAMLQDGATFEKVRLPFHYGEEKLTFADFDGALGGGSVKGSLTLYLKKHDSPFDLQLALEGVDLARAITDPAWQIRAGQLQVALDLHGASGASHRGTGHGELRVKDAAVESLEPLLRLVGVMCHLPELANLKLSLGNNLATFGQTLGIPETVALREASAVFTMDEKQTTIERLVIDGGDLGFGARGTVAQDGKLLIDANLNVSEKLAKQLPTFVRDSLGQAEGTGRRAIAFNITGKNDRPKTNLVDKVIGSKIGDQVNDVVSSIFGNKKEKDAEKEKRDEEKRLKKLKKEEEKKAKMDQAAAAPGAPPTAPASTPPPPLPPVSPEPPVPPAPAVR